MIEPCAHELAGFGGLLSFRINACEDYYEQVREAYVVAGSYGTPVGGAYSDDYTPELAANARRTVECINAFLQAGGFDGHVNSGWRPPAVNGVTKGAAPHSKHMQALACDLFDPGGLIDRFCLEKPEVLERIGLWQETPGSTPGWCHLQIVPPASGHRVFIP